MSVYVVLVNYNGWRDTVECLESVFRSDLPGFRVVVCDNGSRDGSLDRIESWARENACLSAMGKTPFARYRRSEAESGGIHEESAPLVLIDCGDNLGFAGGNNVALRYAVSRGDLDYAWLLNNDTVVAPDAMRRMVHRLEESGGSGLCGSTLLHYEARDRVQALGGGWYCKWLGLAWHLGRLGRWPARVERGRVERRMSYPVGASLMASRDFIDAVGLMCEEYFLFFEELDWVLRAKGAFALCWAPESLVYHKVGASIGTSSNPARKSAVCDYWNARNRIFFTRRFFPEALPTVYLLLFGTLVTRLLLGRWSRAAMIARVLTGREGE